MTMILHSFSWMVQPKLSHPERWYYLITCTFSAVCINCYWCTVVWDCYTTFYSYEVGYTSVMVNGVCHSVTSSGFIVYAFEQNVFDPQ